MPNCHRREFLKIGAGALIGSLFSTRALATTFTGASPRRSLAFYNIHTSEHLRVCYFEKGRYLPAALSKINHILRDYRTDAIKAIDPHLLDILHTINERIGSKETFHVISGYRTALTNALLRRESKGVAKASLHIQGQAIDIRLPGYSTARLRNLCVSLRAGGVGYYPRSDFVHIDTGRVRTW
jgi:uncharacterized protein YcbK (DUF882 family)